MLTRFITLFLCAINIVVNCHDVLPGIKITKPHINLQKLKALPAKILNEHKEKKLLKTFLKSVNRYHRSLLSEEQSSIVPKYWKSPLIDDKFSLQNPLRSSSREHQSSVISSYSSSSSDSSSSSEEEKGLRNFNSEDFTLGGKSWASLEDQDPITEDYNRRPTRRKSFYFTNSLEIISDQNLSTIVNPSTGRFTKINVTNKELLSERSKDLNYLRRLETKNLLRTFKSTETTRYLNTHKRGFLFSELKNHNNSKRDSLDAIQRNEIEKLSSLVINVNTSKETQGNSSLSSSTTTSTMNTTETPTSVSTTTEETVKTEDPINLTSNETDDNDNRNNEEIMFSLTNITTKEAVEQDNSSNSNKQKTYEDSVENFINDVNIAATKASFINETLSETETQNVTTTSTTGETHLRRKRSLKVDSESNIGDHNVSVALSELNKFLEVYNKSNQMKDTKSLLNLVGVFDRIKTYNFTLTTIFQPQFLSTLRQTRKATIDAIKGFFEKLKTTQEVTDSSLFQTKLMTRLRHARNTTHGVLKGFIEKLKTQKKLTNSTVIQKKIINGIRHKQNTTFDVIKAYANGVKEAFQNRISSVPKSWRAFFNIRKVARNFPDPTPIPFI